MPLPQPSKSPTLFPTWHTPSTSPTEYGFPTKAPLITSSTLAPSETPEEDKDLDAGSAFVDDDDDEEDAAYEEYSPADDQDRKLVSMTVDAKGNQGFLI